MEIKTKFNYGDKVTFLSTNVELLDANSEKRDDGLSNGEILVCEGVVDDIHVIP